MGIERGKKEEKPRANRFEEARSAGSIEKEILRD